MSKTKAEVLATASDLTDTVPFPEHDWEPEVRALNDAEFARAQALLLNGQQISASRSQLESGEAGGEQVMMNLGGLVEGEFDSRVYVCSKGLLSDKWSEADVRRIPFPGAIAKISAKILELGGHSLYEGLDKGVRRQVTTFRKESRGAGDSGASDHGDSSSEEPNRDDNVAEGIPSGSDEGSIAASAG